MMALPLSGLLLVAALLVFAWVDSLSIPDAGAAECDDENVVAP